MPPTQNMWSVICETVEMVFHAANGKSELGVLRKNFIA
jgi:hypothetical protein